MNDQCGGFAVSHDASRENCVHFYDFFMFVGLAARLFPVCTAWQTRLWKAAPSWQRRCRHLWNRYEGDLDVNKTLKDLLGHVDAQWGLQVFGGLPTFTGRLGDRGSFLIITPFFLFPLWQSLALVMAHIAAPACWSFQCSWSETTNALAALRSAWRAHPQLQTAVTAEDVHFVCRVCPKIVSICIFGNGNVCMINLSVRGTQRER